MHFPKQEKLIAERILQQRTLHVRVLRRDVARIAKEIITDPHFSASPGWISKFMRRYTSYRVKTTAGQSLPKNVSERIIDYVTNCRKRITRNQLPLNCIANMDETAVWADMPGNSTIEVRGAHALQIATTGHDKQRITICLAAFADGTKLKPFIVLKEVCELHRPTLRFIPSRARPAFARVLSASLRSVLSDNSEEAWLKLFMLPKCVLPSSKRRGRNLKPTSIETLCKLWSDKEFSLLYSRCSKHSFTNFHMFLSQRLSQSPVIGQGTHLCLYFSGWRQFDCPE